jgi:cobalt-zinc-cadmium efflux system membrane fusion protein
MKSAMELMFILSVYLIMALFVSGCDRKTDENDKNSLAQSTSKDEEGDAHAPNVKKIEDNDHSDNDHSARGHGDGEKEEKFNSKELLEKICEHKIKTYLCDECRYEIGIVKADKCLFEVDPKTGKSFLSKIKTDKRKFLTLISATGEISLNENRTSNVSPRVEGIIKSSEVDIGDKVKEGGILFTIDSVEVGGTVNEYLNYKSILTLESRNLERIKALYEKRIVSEQDFIEASIKYEETLTALRTAKNKMEIYGLTAKDIDGINAESDGHVISKLPIRAPIKGTVIVKHAVNGEHWDPEDEIDIMVVSDLDNLWVLADVYESDLKALLDANSEKAECEIETLSFKGKTFRGTIEKIGMTIDETTRTIKVRIAVGNPDGILRPGMFCSVKIPSGLSEEVMAVPESAVLSDEGKSFVFVEILENFYVRKAVVTGRKHEGYVEILEGLAVDEQVVSTGSFVFKSDVLREKMGAGCAD